MKIRTANELKKLNAALDKCTHSVWLMGPNDEAYNLKNEEEYIEGIIRLAEDHDDQLGIFTTSREDEMTMMNFLEKMAAMDCEAVHSSLFGARKMSANAHASMPFAAAFPAASYMFAKRPLHWTYASMRRLSVKNV